MPGQAPTLLPGGQHPNLTSAPGCAVPNARQPSSPAAVLCQERLATGPPRSCGSRLPPRVGYVSLTTGREGGGLRENLASGAATALRPPGARSSAATAEADECADRGSSKVAGRTRPPARHSYVCRA